MKKTFTLLSLVSLSLITYAQDSKLSLDEVTVTATKFAKKSSETGKVVSVISKEEIERNRGKSLSDLLNIQSGLSLNGANSNAGTNISTYMRGAATGYTLILIDGIPVNDPSQITNDYDINLISISMIDHVEILKGGNSTLYGSDAVAGVINIISKKGGDKRLGINALLTAGSYQSYKQNLGLNGKTGNFDFNFSATNENTNGFSSAKNGSDTGEFDNDAFHLKAANLGLGWQSTNTLMIRPFIRYSQTTNMLDYGAFTDDKDYNGRSSDLNTGFTSSLQLPKSLFNFSYAYNDVKRYFKNDSLTGPQEFSLSDTKGQVHNAELFGKFNLSSHIELLTGANYRFNNTDQFSQYISPFYTPPVSKINPDSAKNSISSIYASVFLKNLSGFNFELGGRYNHHSIYGNNFTYTINPSFLIEENVKVFVNVSSAFKTPSLYQLFSVYGNTDLIPEKSSSYEAGFQVVGDATKAKFTFNAFKRNIKDVITFQTDPNTFKSKYVNLNEQNDQGFESEAEYQLFSKLNIKAFYTLVYGKVTNNSISINNLYRRPRNSFGINAGWNAAENLFVSANLKLVGKRTDPFFDPVTFKSQILVLDNYSLLNFYAEYRFVKRFKVFVELNNLLDEQYTEITGFNTRGFNINTGLSFNL
ncbi:TonB-dependent receptor plug domain-containing protein [Solitalea koreensis]|uniref:Vitamin B12 transporter n=1 Tax=Solitalea koreensis TaxID=543615 RepID=A0A521BDZ4_9SPHI|nr:TonB-dependent receptor [Solitalea koreensis]SMO44950.1 vitamin B12 transporter [Solitalea koreensis]